MPNKKKKVDDLSPRKLAREYGFGWRFFRSDPELWQLLKDATSGPDAPWDDARFAAKFKATKWYRTHSETYRTNYALKYSDPATYRERFGNYKTSLRNLAEQWGASLSTEELNTYANRGFLLGWDESQMVDAIAKEVVPDQYNHYKGQLSSVEQRLREVAQKNGMRITDDQLQQWMRNIVRGNSDPSEFETYIREISARTYSAYAKEIHSGVDAMDLAAPYINSMANILEMNPGAIGLDDRMLRKAMTYVDGNGKPAPMSVADFEDSLRADPRWAHTQQANDQMRDWGIQLAKAWGLM